VVLKDTGPRSGTVRDWHRSERPRERLRALSPGGLATRELLAILIGSGSAGSTSIDVATRLLALCGGSLRTMARRPMRDLETVPGVGPAVSARLSAARELGRRLASEASDPRRRIRRPADVFRLCGPRLRDLPHEEFWVILLDSQHAVIRELQVSRGILDASLVHPREVFRLAIAESASALILVHNHPSGDVSPSAEDLAVTTQLARSGRILGIPVLDHVIVGDGRWTSLAESGSLADTSDG
jgi:DNA repair protein RadC